MADMNNFFDNLDSNDDFAGLSSQPTTQAATSTTLPSTTKTETSSTKLSSNNEVSSGSGISIPPRFRKKAQELVYWKDLRETGAVFAVGLIVLLSMTCCSIISVFSWISLLTLSGTISFRIYRVIVGAVQKKDDGVPFKEYLDIDITPSSEKVHQITEVCLKHFNCTILRLRSVFLVEDIFDSLKFLFGFYLLTFVGSWFNGLTLIILAYIGVFSIPKLYDMYKEQIDAYMALAMNQVQNLLATVKSKIPGSKKDKAQ